jgi:hypothetical protein
VLACAQEYVFSFQYGPDGAPAVALEARANGATKTSSFGKVRHPGAAAGQLPCTSLGGSASWDRLEVFRAAQLTN